MPQTGMDMWVIAGVVVAVIAALIAYLQLRAKPGLPIVHNDITNGNRNRQSSGKGSTVNRITDGDDNVQGD